MKNRLWIAVVALLSVTACNQTVGECWPVGQGDGDATVGSGPIVPGGAGGSLGDAPSGSGGTKFPEADCNSKPKEPEPPGSGEGSQEDKCAIGPGTAGSPATDGTTYTFCSGPCTAKCSVGGVNYFSPIVFNFVTIVADDGTDKGGGWQEAVAKLKVSRWIGLLPESWNCPVKVGTPLRTKINGKISPELAASISAEVATDAAGFLNTTSPALPPGIFCTKLKDTMNLMIKARLAGSKVELP